MENFWKRYNKVVLDKLALDKEKRDLLQENTQLRAVLKQYLDGTTPHCYMLYHVLGFLPKNIFASSLVKMSVKTVVHFSRIVAKRSVFHWSIPLVLLECSQNEIR